MKKVVLLGTQHPLQEASPHVAAERLLEFEECLHILCSSNGTAAIAEEMSKECLGEWNHKRPYRESIPFEVALKLGLAHQYIDPDSKERVALGIRSIETNPARRASLNLPDVPLAHLLDQEKIEYGKREDEWLRRILVMDRWPLLFICGLDHVSTFTDRLQGANLNVLVSPPFIISIAD